eukprot:m.154308 g.154308  ORF g.154308 m.154308 type:complete len:204 (-) comp30882_c1_seq2:139-750(-)
MPQKDMRPKGVRQAEKQREIDAMAKKIQEDASWKDDTPKKKSQLKRDQADLKRDEAIRKKAEIKSLLKEEEREMARKTTKVKKVTIFTITKQKEEREKMMKEDNRLKKLAQLNITPRADYLAQIDLGNLNRSPEQIASGVDAGLSQLESEDAATPTVWTYKLYEAANLSRIKQEKPGLKASGYREIVKKEWNRFHLNPDNAKR